MKNVTITLDEEVLRWARITAAEHETSVSRMVGEILAEKMGGEKARRLAKERFFSRHVRPLRNEGEKLPSRDEIHER